MALIPTRGTNRSAKWKTISLIPAKMHISYSSQYPFHLPKFQISPRQYINTAKITCKKSLRKSQSLPTMRPRAFDVEALSNVDDICPFQWRHLRKFYFSLLCVSASSTLGAYFTEYIGSHFGLFGALASFYCFYLTPPWHEKKRVFLISLVACFGWAFVNPWLTYVLSADAGFIVTLLSATCVGFGCYWVASIWTGCFGWVYYKALCLCSILVLTCLYICSSVFGGNSAHWMYPLHPLVSWYMVYVAAYSQFVMFKARGGENDYVMHAICLFVFCPDLVMVILKMMKEMCTRQ